MTITQTVEIPADRWLYIKVPQEIPAGKAVLAFTPMTNIQNAETDKKISLTKEEIEEMIKNSPILNKLSGILHTDMSIEEIRSKRLVKHL